MKPRLLAVCMAAGGFAALLLGRLGHVQIIDGFWYRQLAEANRAFSTPIQANRGVFLDRYQELLTYNSPQYYLETSPDSLYSPRQPLTRSDALLKLSDGQSVVNFTLGRVVRYPEAMAHVLGYVGPVTADELQRTPELAGYDLVGKLGLEKLFDESLRGVRGQTTFEVTAQGKKQRVLSVTNPQAGSAISTTIDPYLSQIALQAMGDRVGSVLIGDADTGEILTMISTPGFSSNDLGKTETDPAAEQARQARIKAYVTHPQKVFFNRAVSGQYPMGSIFKIVTALSGLESGAFDENTVVVDEGTLKIGDDYSYANWYYTQYGRVEGAISLQRAIARSNDIYFYKAAEWIGPERLAQMARLFGFGAATGVEVPGEADGLVPDPAWKEKTLGERWFLGNTYHFGIGQDNLLVTPIQVQQLLQTVGNQGTMCRPKLVVTGNDPKAASQSLCTELSISEPHLNTVLKGMLDACSTGGTAFPFFERNRLKRDPSLTPAEEISRGAVACKTGTAEFGAADAQGHRRTHAWFGAVVGIPTLSQATEKESAQSTASASLREAWLKATQVHNFPNSLVITVLVESEEARPFAEGSKEAAPIAQQIIDWIVPLSDSELEPVTDTTSNQ